MGGNRAGEEWIRDGLHQGRGGKRCSGEGYRKRSAVMVGGIKETGSGEGRKGKGRERKICRWVNW